MEELTDELNTMMKSREPDVWINDEAVHLPPKFKMKEKIEYKFKLSDVLKGGPGAERYGCVWNKSKFKQGPDVRYLKDEEALLDILEVLIRDKAKEHLAKKLFTKAMEEFKKAMEKFKTENFSEIFSRTPSAFHVHAQIRRPEGEQRNQQQDPLSRLPSHFLQPQIRGAG